MLVFISHSTAPNSPRDKEYLDAVVAALEKPEFKVLLDRKSLEGSDEWPRELDAYMDECHAAVILFSRRALRSVWVNKEAAILNWRRSREPDFLLLPVALDGVSAKAVRTNKRFAAMDVGRWQFVESGTPAEVANRILELCSNRVPQPNSTPAERLAIKLTGMLEDAKQADLRDGALRLGIAASAMGGRGQAKLAKLLANKLAKARLEELHPLVRALAPAIGAAQTRKLIKCVRSLWVEAEAAGKIPPVAESPEPRKVIGLNGRKLPDFTASCYLDRAYRGDVVHKLIQVDTGLGQNTFEEAAGQIEKHFAQRRIASEDLDRYLNETPSRYFVLMPPPVPEAKLLERLQTRFPRLTFLLTTGRDAHDDPRMKKLPRLVPLEPALDTQREERALFLQEDLKVILENVSEELI